MKWYLEEVECLKDPYEIKLWCFDRGIFYLKSSRRLSRNSEGWRLVDDRLMNSKSDPYFHLDHKSLSPISNGEASMIIFESLPIDPDGLSYMWGD